MGRNRRQMQHRRPHRTIMRSINSGSISPMRFISRLPSDMQCRSVKVSSPTRSSGTPPAFGSAPTSPTLPGRDGHLPSRPCLRVAGLLEVFLVHDAHAVREQVPLLEAAARGRPTRRRVGPTPDRSRTMPARSSAPGKVLEGDGLCLRLVRRLAGVYPADLTPEPVER